MENQGVTVKEVLEHTEALRDARLTIEEFGERCDLIATLLPLFDVSLSSLRQEGK